MDAAARAAGIADTSDPTADPSRDVEPGHHYRSSTNHSRISLPLSRQRSFSMTSRSRADSRPHISGLPYNVEGDGMNEGPEEGVGEDPEWGPAHACFPHPNPHVPLASSLYQNTRIIRVKRDWMVVGDLAPTFSNVYPEILDPLIKEDNFRSLIDHVNMELIRIFDPWRARAWLDAGMGYATGWLWDDLGLTGAKKELAKLESWLVRWNKDVAEPEGCRVVPLRRTAYLCLDIQIPDPQITPELPEPSEAGETEAGRENGVKNRLSTRSNLSRKYRSGPRSDYSGYTTGSASRQQPTEGDGPRPVVPPIPGKYLGDSSADLEKQ